MPRNGLAGPVRNVKAPPWSDWMAYWFGTVNCLGGLVVWIVGLCWWGLATEEGRAAFGSVNCLGKWLSISVWGC
jgi:hypothetical protein